MAGECVTVLEVGTTWVTALTGERRDDGSLFVTGLGRTPSCGVRKGVVADMEKATECVRRAVEDAEESSGRAIREVFLVVSGGHVQSLVNHVNVAIRDPAGRVTEEDLDRAAETARAVNLPAGHDILHTITQKYAVDDHDGVLNPVGMTGAMLAMDLLVVHARENLVLNTIQTVQNAGLDVCDVAFSGLCAALATLTPEQKECGALTVDLGGGATSYLAYAHGAIVAAAGLAVGGDHVTNDLSLAFNLPLARAAALKHESGAALVDPSAHFQRVAVPEEVGFTACTLGLSDLNTAIHARMEELFELIRGDLKRVCDLRSFGAGVVLTGGGASLRRIEELAAQVFDLPCAVGRPRGFGGLTALSKEGAEYAAPLGMLRYALRSLRTPGRSGTLKGLMRRVLGRR
jgi:cell division protein FtsA